MKILLLVLAGLALAHGSLTSYMQNIQKHDSFQKLSTEEKLMFSELIIAAETNTLKPFLDRVGYVKVMQLLDDLAHPDAQKLSAYLAEHLGYHNHASANQGILQKRDNDDKSDDSDDNDDDHHSRHHSTQLSHADKKVFNDYKAAAQSDMLTDFITNVGLGSIFGVLEKLGESDASTFLKQALSTVEKRQDDTASAASGDDDTASAASASGNHDNDDASAASNASGDDDNASGEARLSKADSKVYHGLNKAAKTGQLTDYIHSIGGGNLFGLLEKLDVAQGEKLIQDMISSLQSSPLEKRDDSGDSDSGSSNSGDSDSGSSDSGDSDSGSSDSGSSDSGSSDSGSSDSGDDSKDDDNSGSNGGNNQNRIKLSRADERVVNQLNILSESDMLQAYISKVGLGSIFGVMEKLTKDQASRLTGHIQNVMHA